MYAASEAFHAAVRNNAPQRALLIFEDAFFTNEDVNVERGIEFADSFNEETDLSIGQTLSNQVRFTLYNDEGLLDDYQFGTFTATIGARISQDTYKQRAYVTVISGRNNTYLGNAQYPYLTRNGSAMSVTFPVRSIFILDDTVHVFGDKGYYKAFSDVTGNAKSISANAFMMNKAARMNAVGMSYTSASRSMKEYVGGVIGIYEFVPLGVFTAVRPNVGTVIEIDFTCNDQMQLFDRDMPEDLTIEYPATLDDILSVLCNYVGVARTPGGFLNSGAVIEKEPEEFRKATMRRVLGWIAEAACANARFNRDGVLKLEWIRQTNQVFDEGEYIQFNPYWYSVPRIDKIYNRNTSDGLEAVEGTGTNGYLIQDNPFMALARVDFEITVNPQNQTVEPNQRVTLFALAQGGDIEYQWQKKNLETGEWFNLAGETGTSFSLTSSASEPMSRYRCEVKLGNRKKYTKGATIIVEEEGDGE